MANDERAENVVIEVEYGEVKQEWIGGCLTVLGVADRLLARAAQKLSGINNPCPSRDNYKGAVFGPRNGQISLNPQDG